MATVKEIKEEFKTRVKERFDRLYKLFALATEADANETVRLIEMTEEGLDMDDILDLFDIVNEVESKPLKANIQIEL